MNGSRRIKYVPFLIGIVILAGSIFYYYNNRKKAVELLLPDLSKITFLNASIKNGDTIHSKASVVVQNKSPYKLTIDSLYFKVELNKKKLIEEFVLLNLRQEKHQVDTIQLPIDLSRKKLKAILDELNEVDSTDLNIDCALLYDTFLGHVKLKYDKEMHIPVPIPPRVKVVQVEQKKFNTFDKALQTIIHLEIINKGKNIDLQLQHVQYSLQVENSLSSNGTIDKIIDIKPESTSYLEIPVEIEIDRPLKTIVDVLTNNDKKNYLLHLKGEIIEHMVDKPKHPPFPFEIDARGELELKK